MFASFQRCLGNAYSGIKTATKNNMYKARMRCVACNTGAVSHIFVPCDQSPDDRCSLSFCGRLTEYSSATTWPYTWHGAMSSIMVLPKWRHATPACFLRSNLLPITRTRKEGWRHVQKSPPQPTSWEFCGRASDRSGTKVVPKLQRQFRYHSRNDTCQGKRKAFSSPSR